MELKLIDGRYVRGEFQGFAVVDGIDEIMQRVRMKLVVKKGSFMPLPEYGSRLHTLSAVKPSLRESAARQFVSEALADESALSLESLELIYEEDGTAMLLLSFVYNGDVRFEVSL